MHRTGTFRKLLALARAVLAALVVLCMPGCTRYIAHQIEHPGHDSTPIWPTIETWMGKDGFQRDRLEVAPDIRLSYWYSRPMPLAITYRVKEHRQEHRVRMDFNFNFKPDTHRSPPAQPRGSVVLLPAWSEQGASMINWGVEFANAGYVVVMPDLRDQGQSSPAPIGYGMREGRDIASLVHRLRSQNRLPGPLYLMGVSYGASTAVFGAARIPHVRAVVAMEPFVNAANVIRRIPKSGLFGHPWLYSHISSATMNAAIARAGHDLGIDLDRIDLNRVADTLQACTVLLHGEYDALTSERAMRALAGHSPRIQFLAVPDESHLTLPFRSDLLFRPLLHWMTAVPAAPKALCPGLPDLPRGVPAPP